MTAAPTGKVCVSCTFTPQETRHMLLKNQVAIITGGAGINGLGFATARLMAEQGAKVAILDLEGADPAGAAARLGEGHLGLVPM